MVLNLLGGNLAIVWDLIAMVISLVCLLLLVGINGEIQKSGKLDSIITRKIVHIFAGPIFLVSWLLFSGSIFSRYIAMIIPILFILLFYAIGTGKMENERFVASMSRSGDASELLKGTLYYAVIMLIVTIIWFYVPITGAANANPAGLIIMGCLSGGDGLADIIGRKYGGEKKFGIGGGEKTIVGVIAMFLGSFLVGLILTVIFSLEPGTTICIGSVIVPLLIISIVATVVEALSPKNVDNWTIFLAVIITVLILSFFPSIWPFSVLSF